MALIKARSNWGSFFIDSKYLAALRLLAVRGGPVRFRSEGVFAIPLLAAPDPVACD